MRTQTEHTLNINLSKFDTQTLQIQEVHLVAHSSACNFCHFLSIFVTYSI